MVRSSSIYVGNVPHDTHARDLEELFSKYGTIKHVDIKGRPSNGPLYAFVEFEDMR